MTSKRLADLCAHVAEQQRELLDGIAPSAALRQALARRVEQRRGAPAQRQPRRNLRWWLAAAALVPVSVLGLRWFIPSEPVSEPLHFTVAGRDGVLHAWESAPSSRELSLDFSDGSRFSLAPEARARVVAVGPRGAEVVIESGHARAEVVPRPGVPARWRVRTGPFEIEVKGTRFDVGWNPGTEEFSLRLFQGNVSISGCAFGSGVEVRANEQVEASCRRPDFVVRPLSEGVEAQESPTPAPAPASTEAADAPPSSVAPERSPARRARSTMSSTPSLHRRWLALARRGHFEPAYELARPVFDAECREASLDEVLVLADTARHAGHAEQARRAYLAIRSRATGTPASAAAAFELGRLRFDQDPEEASRWFALSLAERPRGPLAQASRDRLLEAGVRLGDGERLRRLAAKYLEESPEGPRASEAREILRRGNSSR
jgi:FecR protein